MVLEYKEFTFWYQGHDLNKVQYIEDFENRFEIIIDDETTLTILRVDCSDSESKILQSLCDYYEQYEDHSDWLIEEVRASKIEELRTACNECILAGFYSSAKGNTRKLYTFDMEDQTNILGIMLSITMGFEFPLRWKDASMLVSEVWTNQEFIQLYEDAINAKASKMIQFHTLRYMILNTTTTIEEVQAFAWIDPTNV